jgi:hypothetical protein
MDNSFWCVISEEACHAIAISQVEPEKVKPCAISELSESPLFEPDIVIGIEVVDAHNCVTTCQ